MPVSVYVSVHARVYESASVYVPGYASVHVSAAEAVYVYE